MFPVALPARVGASISTTGYPWRFHGLVVWLPDLSKLDMERVPQNLRIETLDLPRDSEMWHPAFLNQSFHILGRARNSEILTMSTAWPRHNVAIAKDYSKSCILVICQQVDLQTPPLLVSLWPDMSELQIKVNIELFRSRNLHGSVQNLSVLPTPGVPHLSTVLNLALSAGSCRWISFWRWKSMKISGDQWLKGAATRLGWKDAFLRSTRQLKGQTDQKNIDFKCLTFGI